MSVSEQIGTMVADPIQGFSVTIGRNAYTDRPAVQVKIDDKLTFVIDDEYLLDELALDLLTARRSLIRRQKTG